MMMIVVSGDEQVGLIFDQAHENKWQYEEVTVTTGDGLVVDLTKAVERKGSSSPRSIIIDAPHYTVKEEGSQEQQEFYTRKGGQQPRGGRSYQEKRYPPRS